MSWTPPWVEGLLPDTELQDRMFRYLSQGFEDDEKGGYMRIRGRPKVEVRNEACGFFEPWEVMAASRKMKPGVWYSHSTTRDPFRRFTYGTNYCQMFESVNKVNKDRADCAVNLTNMIPDDQRVWGFAYLAPITTYGRELRKSQGLWSPEDEQAYNMRRWMLYRSGRSQAYGNNTIYFKSNAAIEIYHTGDHDWQIMFPLCSEYDVFTSDDAREFPKGVEGAMDYIDSGAGKFSGLSGLTRGPRLAFR